jgi:hypothetical protein
LAGQIEALGREGVDEAEQVLSLLSPLRATERRIVGELIEPRAKRVDRLDPVLRIALRIDRRDSLRGEVRAPCPLRSARRLSSGCAGRLRRRRWLRRRATRLDGSGPVPEQRGGSS